MIRLNIIRLRLMIGLAAGLFLLGGGLYFAPAGEEGQTEFYSQLCFSAAAVLTIVLFAGFVPLRQLALLKLPYHSTRLRFPIMAVCVIGIGLLLHSLFNSYFVPLTQTLSSINGE